MNLVELHNKIITTERLQDLISRSLHSISTNKLRNVYSITIKLKNTTEAQQALYFCQTKLNDLVKAGVITELFIDKRAREPYNYKNLEYYTIHKPFFSAPNKSYIEEFIFYIPDEDLICLYFLAEWTTTTSAVIM